MAVHEVHARRRECRAGHVAGIAERGKRVAGVHRGQLVAITDQHQQRVGSYGLHQLAHQRQVDHRGFVHHHQVGRQRVVAMVAEAVAAVPAEHAVHRARFGGQPRGDRRVE
jgi:hypothetical protein